MAPEQLLGEADDARTDVYALGVMPFEMVTGQRPLEKARPEALMFEYASALNLDLSFQNFAKEIEHLSTEYGPPKGAFLLAQENGLRVGCVGLREFSETTGEVKRLYVVPALGGAELDESWLRESWPWESSLATLVLSSIRCQL